MSAGPSSEADRDLQQLAALTPAEWARSTPLQTVEYGPLLQRGLTLKMKRDDTLDTRLSGNKLYKLYGHLQLARQRGATRLVSFGGYYSNHLHALAYLGRAMGLKTAGIVRGHRPPQLSATLQDCVAQGMELYFVSRQQYRQWREACVGSAAVSAALPPLNSPDSYLIAEGGGGEAGLTGCAAIMTALREQTDLTNATVCVACGTGTTLAGLLSTAQAGERLLGFAALKLGEQLPDYRASIAAQLVGQSIGACWDILDDRHCGGFGKVSPALMAFMQQFEAETGVLLDPVYTAKMLFAVVHLAQDGYWSAGDELVVVHSGGLQGRRGYQLGP